MGRGVLPGLVRSAAVGTPLDLVEKRFRRRLLGGALRRRGRGGAPSVGEARLDGEARRMVRPLAGDLDIVRGCFSPRLRPFLKRGLGIAGVGVDGLDPVSPEARI